MDIALSREDMHLLNNSLYCVIMIKGYEKHAYLIFKKRIVFYLVLIHTFSLLIASSASMIISFTPSIS
jgi:hypothetical protein